MCRAVEIPSANRFRNTMDWLEVATERDTEVDVYALADANELPGIREEIMQGKNVWAYMLDPSLDDDEADETSDEQEADDDDRADGNVGKEKDDEERHARNKKVAVPKGEGRLLWYLVLTMLVLVLVLTSFADTVICYGPWLTGRKPFC